MQSTVQCNNKHKNLSYASLSVYLHFSEHRKTT